MVGGAAERMTDSTDPDLDNIAAEVAEDLAKGEGAKHFPELLDASTGATAIVEDAATMERLRRFCLEFAAGLNDRLRGNEHGFWCTGVNLDGEGKGFVCKFRDKDTRPFTAECSYDDGFEAAAKYGKESMGRGMMAVVIERLIAARVRYFERMNKTH